MCFKDITIEIDQTLNAQYRLKLLILQLLLLLSKKKKKKTSCFNYEQEKYHWILIAYPNKILTQPKNVLILFELLIISLTLTLFAKKMI